MTRVRMGDERGLVSKGMVVFLVILVLFGVAAIDGISIIFTRYRVSDLASKAAFDGASELNRTGATDGACAAARALVERESTTAKVPKEGCTIDDGEVTVVVRDDATTMVVDKVDFLSDLAVAESSSTSAGAAA